MKLKQFNAWLLIILCFVMLNGISNGGGVKMILSILRIQLAK